MESEFDKLLDKLISSTRSPRGRFSQSASWLLLEKRLFATRPTRLWLRISTAAATIAMLTLVSWWGYEQLKPIPMQTVSTLAETRLVQLPDQSEIILNRYSTLQYPRRFKKKERRVKLEGGGYFTVSKATNRPFRVETEAMVIEVLGTRFDVEAYAQDTQVKTTLLEGSVAINLPGKATTPLLLSPNESAIYHKEEGRLTLQAEPDASQKIAWCNGTLCFLHLPLHEIARQLSNAFHTEIHIREASIRDYRMTGTFTNDQSLEEILSLLCRNQPFAYTKSQNGILITQKLN